MKLKHQSMFLLLQQELIMLIYLKVIKWWNSSSNNPFNSLSQIPSVSVGGLFLFSSFIAVVAQDFQVAVVAKDFQILLNIPQRNNFNGTENFDDIEDHEDDEGSMSWA